MSATILQFPSITFCPACLTRMPTVDLHAHIHDCPVRAARMAHPSNRKPDGGGVA